MYLHLLASSSINKLNSGIESIERVFFRSYIFYLSFSYRLAFYNYYLILSSNTKSASSIKMSNNSANFSYDITRVSSYSSYYCPPSKFSFYFSTGLSSSVWLAPGQSIPNCWLWMTMSHFMILSLSFWTYSSFIAWI